MAKRTNKHSPLIFKLLARFREVDFKEQYIPNREGHEILGEYDGECITINPVPHIVDTLIHELLHLVHPTYSEQAIRSLTGKVMKQLTEAELLAIYHEYKRKLEEDE